MIKNTSSGVTLASFDLGYDLAGNVTSKASSVFANAANGTWSYTYDGASRLTKATGPSGTGQTSTWDYAYDGAGNRTLLKQTVGSTVTKNLTTTYGVGGLPTSATDAATGESITYTHDEIGDLTLVDSSIGTNDWSYTYDAWGRTTCAKQAPTCASGSGQVSWKLDAFDRTFTRSATAGSKTTVTTPTYRGIGEQLAKLVEGSTTTLELTSPSGIPLGEKVGSGSPRFFLADPHGDIVGLVSTQAANLGTGAFDPYGTPITAPTGSVLGYQGDLTDPVTKQVDMGTRWYAPGLGRFASRDIVFGELTAPMSLNRFAYGEMNPITMVDPTGMGPTCDPQPCGDPDTQHDLTDAYSASHEGKGFHPDDEGDDAGTGPTQTDPGPHPVPPNVRVIVGVLVDLLNTGWDQLSRAAQEASEEIRTILINVGFMGPTRMAQTLETLARDWKRGGLARLGFFLDDSLRSGGAVTYGGLFAGATFVLSAIDAKGRYDRLRNEGVGAPEALERAAIASAVAPAAGVVSAGVCAATVGVGCVPAGMVGAVFSDMFADRAAEFVYDLQIRFERLMSPQPWSLGM